VLSGLHVEISASAIRNGIHARVTAAGGAPADLDRVSPPVREYIVEHGLYGLLFAQKDQRVDA
jgi:hypothetical protein